jgi:hypothetical protein
MCEQRERERGEKEKRERVKRKREKRERQKRVRGVQKKLFNEICLSMKFETLNVNYKSKTF